MKNLGITKCLNAKSDIGLDEINDNLYQCIVTSNELGFNVAHVFGTTPAECEKNADLVSDAFNTANKCGMLPSELFEQRDELLIVLKSIVQPKNTDEKVLIWDEAIKILQSYE